MCSLIGNVWDCYIPKNLRLRDLFVLFMNAKYFDHVHSDDESVTIKEGTRSSANTTVNVANVPDHQSTRPWMNACVTLTWGNFPKWTGQCSFQWCLQFINDKKHNQPLPPVLIHESSTDCVFCHLAVPMLLNLSPQATLILSLSINVYSRHRSYVFAFEETYRCLLYALPLLSVSYSCSRLPSHWFSLWLHCKGLGSTF